MNNKIKLGIAIPLTDDKCYSSFFDSFVLLDKPPFTYIRPMGYAPIDKVRNDLVRQALECKCTHLLMMDSDQVYPSDTITKLLTHDLDVVSAKVHRRYPPFDGLLYRGTIGEYEFVPDEEIVNNKLIEIDATGCGCIMYKTEVFKNIPEPWFEFSKNQHGKDVGEDIGFCHKLREAGYKIFTDTTIDISHLSLLSVNWGTYKLYKKLKEIGSNNK